jgi:type I restriction enzyme R subunit
MSQFTEANTIEDAIRDALTGLAAAPQDKTVRETSAAYTIGSELQRLPLQSWQFIKASDLPRSEQDVLVEPFLHAALVRLNPDIATHPANADEVIYKLRGILLSAASSGLVKANEAFTTLLRDDFSMPFGENHEHVPVRLIDFANPQNNQFVITQQYTYRPSPRLEKRFDLVLLVNGIPLVVGEVKSPVRPAVTWADAAQDFIEDYWRTVPALFVPNLCCFASEGKTFRYAAVQADFKQWLPWGDTEEREPTQPSLDAVLQAVRRMLRPEVVLKLLEAFTVFPTSRSGHKTKVIARYPQYEAALQIVARVVDGRVKRGLIWHFQGSGKSLLMVFAAQLLNAHPALRNPTVMIVVDRKDLNTQIGETFDAASVPNILRAGNRAELERVLRQDTRQTIITTIHKFGEAEGVLNQRGNIILMVDEAHRTQEGDLGRTMRAALPNAFIFGLTGTPISRRDRNTFAWFGAPEDSGLYLNHYSYQQAVRDGATLPVKFEPRLVELRIDRAAIDAGFDELADQYDLDETERVALSQRGGRLVHLLKATKRLHTIADDIVQHFGERIEPSGLKGMVVVYDREYCVRMKQALDQRLGADASEIVMITQPGDQERWRDRGLTVSDADYARWQQLDQDSAALEALLDQYHDPSDPLQLLIVTSKLLTGFDAPICQVMYLDKPLRDHTLLQAICRTNRPYSNKAYGLVVDYLGVFDEVAKALDYDPQDIEGVVDGLDNLRTAFPQALAQVLSYFPDVDRTVTGYEGLLAAQDCLRTNEVRDQFAADYRIVARLWETLSPDPMMAAFTNDYRWVSQVYQSIRPTSGIGTLIWSALGPKTLDLIHQNITVETIRDDLETLVLDEDIILNLDEPQRRMKGYELHNTLARRLRSLSSDPRFKALGERLEALKAQYEQGVLESITWLKGMLSVAREVVQAQQETQVQLVADGKQALSHIFQECKVDKTPEIIGRIVADIDQIVRATRFEGWQSTSKGDREIQKVLRQTLHKYQLHRDKELFEKAYAYIRQHY